MKGKYILSLAFVFFFGYLLAPVGAAEKSTVIKGVTFQPSNSNRSIMFQKWFKVINDRAKGRLDMQYLGGPEIIPAPQQGKATSGGAVQMSAVGAALIKGLVPEAGLLALSRISAEEERSVGATAYLQQCFEKAGLYYVGRLDPKIEQNFPICMNKPVRKIADFKGFRLGANATYVKAMAKALGMGFSVVKMEDGYAAMERGMVDGYSTALDLAVAMGLHEATKYYLNHPIYRANAAIMMNLAAWQKLPEDLRKLIQNTYYEMEPQFADASMRSVKEGEVVLEKKGVEFITFSPEEAEKYYDICYKAEADEWIKELPETAPPFLKLVKAIK